MSDRHTQRVFRRLVILGLVLPGALVTGMATGQTPQGRKLEGKEIFELLAEKRVTYLRFRQLAPDSTPDTPRYQTFANPIKAVVTYRRDGSWTMKCTLVLPDGERPCSRVPTDAGVWEIRDNTICMSSLRIRRDQAPCHEIYLQSPKRLFTRRVNDAPSTEDGPGEIE